VGAVPLELFSHSEAHDAWFRAHVLWALEDTRPDVDGADADNTKPHNGATDGAVGPFATTRPNF